MYDNLTRTNLEFAHREAEKRIAELEKSCDETQELLDKQIEATYKLDKENAELKEQLEKHKWNNIFLEDCAVYDNEITEEYKTLQERIAELEKENESLTSIKNIYIGDLLKAKDIMKRLVDLSNSSRSLLGGTWHETVREAEQFLNSEVEK